ncbi:asparagine synthetase B [Parageobacillus thermoglucosidasius]|uniref:asparagine synthetase B family protein n=1 Tax=Parageobacillus thermoglucosidasius TaxID=1426 RepID=UPI000F623549|nr:asparagine synthase-related protein [Parageobacillus thermoglucosidasius]GCD84100.1 asparagine synthetase B [Parageobacillus thermoglucosidasius]
MSAICGMYNLEDIDIDLGKFNIMVNKLEVFGRDEIITWIDGNVGLGQLTLVVTPESSSKTKPQYTHYKRIDYFKLVADCRIDNRAELAEKLDIKKILNQLSDIDLLSLAYKKWNENCVYHIIGDFAFAIWDQREKKVFCARDPMGIRPFFYKFHNKTFYFASQIRAIHNTKNISNWNLDYFADFLYRKGIPSEHDTPYPEVKRLPKGSCLVVTSQGIKLRKFWDLENSTNNINYRTDDEYVEHFKDIFTKAVKSRLRSTDSVGVFMSGGLDSTSIYGLSKLNSTSQKVFPISCVFNHDKVADERYYINHILKKYNEKYYEFIVSDDLWILKNYPNYSIETDEPNRNQLTYALLSASYMRAKERNAKVVLSGYAGDQVFGFNPYYIADYLKKFKLLRFLREAKQLAKANNDTIISTIKEYALNPLQGKHEHSNVLLPKPYIEAKERFENENKFSDPGLRAQYQYIDRAQGFGFAQLISESIGIETRYPFLDVRLVEFLFKIPIEQKIKDAATKVLLRKAMRGIVPDEILGQHGKAATNMLIFQGLKYEWNKISPLLRKPILAELGLIDGKHFYEQIERYRHGVLNRGMDYFSSLILELWIRDHM